MLILLECGLVPGLMGIDGQAVLVLFLGDSLDDCFAGCVVGIPCQLSTSIAQSRRRMLLFRCWARRSASQYIIVMIVCPVRRVCGERFERLSVFGALLVS